MNELLWKWPIVLIVGFIIVIAIAIYIIVSTTPKKRLSDFVKKNYSTAKKAPHPHVKQPLFTWNIKQYLKNSAQTSVLRTYKILSITGIVTVILALLCSTSLVARPSHINETTSSSISRNIVLCLDVSGSALPFDRQVIISYRNLIKNFKSERIGMSIFNSTSRTVFPLTDDYSVVDQQLSAAIDALSGVESQNSIDKMTQQQYQAISDWLAGTQNRKDATSLIGDGLVSCATMMPDFSPTAQNVTRSTPASIVFASDNVLSGTPLYTLDQALDITSNNGISVDALFTGAQQSLQDATTVDMKSRVEAHGGIFTARSSSDSVNELVTKIESQRKEQAESHTDINLIDNSAPWILVFAFLISIFALVMGKVRQ